MSSATWGEAVMGASSLRCGLPIPKDVASGVGVSDDRPGSRGAAWPKREAVPRRQPSIGVERTQSPALP